MNNAIERDLGPQPLGELLARHELGPRDLVAASTEQITYKMVKRGIRGRRLTPNVMVKIRNALNRATGKQYTIADLFTYTR